MNRRKLRKLAKEINNGNEVNIRFISAPEDLFCYDSSDDTLEISSYYHRLPSSEILISLIHEIGHMNTHPKTDYIYMSDYAAEYEANRWALYRLDELQWHTISGQYENYLKDLALLEITDDVDEEYQEAAADLLQNLELL